jgi:hypothetical protein
VDAARPGVDWEITTDGLFPTARAVLEPDGGEIGIDTACAMPQRDRGNLAAVTTSPPEEIGGVRNWTTEVPPSGRKR